MRLQKARDVALSLLGASCVAGLLLAACGPQPTPASGPDVKIVSPESGARGVQNKTLDVHAVAVDNQGVTRVELWVDGSIYRVDEAPSGEGVPIFSATQPWTTDALGTHILIAKATTRDGRAAESAPVLALIEAPTPPAATATFIPLPPTSTATAMPTPTEPPEPSATPEPLLPGDMPGQQPGYPSPSEPTYPTEPGYPGPEPIYPPDQQPGYPQPIYPPDQQPIYPPGQQPGYQQPIYPPDQQPIYPPGQQPGYQQPIYPPDQQPIYPPGQPGYPGYPSQPDSSPMVVIGYPREGARVELGQTIAVRSWARASGGVQRVDLLVDGVLYNSYNAGGQAVVEVEQIWRPERPGARTLEVRALGGSWQVSGSARITVYVSQSGGPGPQRDVVVPTAYIVSPPTGTAVETGRSVQVVALASDEVGVAALELWADGALYASESPPSPQRNWQWGVEWTSTAPGAHTLLVRVRDAAGNRADSPAVQITVHGSGGGSGPGRIYFASESSGTLDVYSMLPDGSAVTRLTMSDRPETSPAVSRDGELLAYGRDGAIWVMQTAGGGEQLVVSDADPAKAASRPAWSPDRQRLAFVRQDHIWVYDFAGGSTRQVTSGAATYDSPSFSADGSLIACSAWQGGPDADVVIISAVDGHIVDAFEAHSGSDGMPVYSPNGSRIAFVRTNGSEAALYAMRADGSDVVRVANRAWAAAWSTDGSRLAYLAPSGSQAEVWIVNANGTNPRRILASVALEGVAWGK